MKIKQEHSSLMSTDCLWIRLKDLACIKKKKKQGSKLDLGRCLRVLIIQLITKSTYKAGYLNAFLMTSYSYANNFNLFGQTLKYLENILELHSFLLTMKNDKNCA